MLGDLGLCDRGRVLSDVVEARMSLRRLREQLDAESLRISVWQGNVELRNLQLKPEALKELELPITVKAGLLGRLTLKVTDRSRG